MACSNGWLVQDGAERVMVELNPGTGWRNVTEWLRGLTVVRGRRGPMSRFDAGQLTVEFDNADAVFSTWNENNFELGGGRAVRAGNMLRVTFKGGSFTDRVFTGWVDEWTETGDTAAEIQGATAVAFDGWDRLARAGQVPVTTPVGVGETSGSRINRLLVKAGWPAGTQIATGTVTMAGTTFERPILDEIHDTTLCEGGASFVDSDGNFRFYDEAMATAGRPTSFFLTNDCTSGWPLVAIEIQSSAAAIVNTAYIGRTDGTPVSAIVTDSIVRYGQRAFARTDLPHENDGQSGDIAERIVSLAANADEMVSSIDIYPATGLNSGEIEALWRFIAQVELVDSVAVVYQPEGHPGSKTTFVAPVDALRIDLTVGTCRCNLRLAPSPSTSPVEIILPPQNLRIQSMTADHITWAWDIPAHGYDALLYRISGPGYDANTITQLPGTQTTFTSGLLKSNSQYTFYLRGRLGVVSTAEVSITVTTKSKPELDPAEGCWIVPFPDDPANCEWRYATVTVDDAGETPIGNGVVPGSAYDTCWRPDLGYLADHMYRTRFELWCNGVHQTDSDTTIEWVEPAFWPGGGGPNDGQTGANPACSYPSLVAPVDAVILQAEICAAVNAFRDISGSGADFQRRSAWGTVTPGPYTPPSGTSPGPAGVKVATSVTSVTTLAGPSSMFGTTNLMTLDDSTYPNAGMTVSFWVKADGTDAYTYAPLVLDTGQWQFRLVNTDGGHPFPRVRWTDFSGIVQDYPASTPAARVDISSGNWHLISIGYGYDIASATRLIRLWFDGQPVGSTVLPTNWATRPHAPTVSMQAAPGHSYAEYTIHHRVLTNAEAAGLFQASPVPATATISFACTLIVDQAYIIGSSQANMPPNSVSGVFKMIWRDKSRTPPPSQGVSNLQATMVRDTNINGTFEEVGFIGTPGPANVVKTANYYGPGATTPDGITLGSNMGALYWDTDYMGGNGQPAQWGPQRWWRRLDFIPVNLGTLYHVSDFGDSPAPYYQQRLDGASTHVRALLPADFPS